MNKINVALVGLGNISKKHIQAIQKTQEFKLVSVCDPKKKLQEFKVYKNIDEMFQNEKNIELVSITSPSGLHYNQVIKSLKFKKNVIVEKPLSMNLRQSKEILKLSKKNKKKVFVVYQNRLSPLIKIVNQKIKNKHLGKLIAFNSTLYWNREDKYYKKSKWRGSKKLDGGVVMNQGTHNLDIFCNFFGKVKSVYCTKVKIKKYLECEDTCLISFIFKNNLIGSFTLSTAVNKENYSNQIEILGVKKNISLLGNNLNILKYQNKITLFKKNNDLHQYFYKFVSKILLKKKKNIFSIESVMNSMKLVDAINKSLRTNSKINL